MRALTLSIFFDIKWFPLFLTDRPPLSCSTAPTLWKRWLLSVTEGEITQCSRWLHSVINERGINPFRSKRLKVASFKNKVDGIVNGFPPVQSCSAAKTVCNLNGSGVIPKILDASIAHPALASTFVGLGWVVSAAAILFRGILCVCVCAFMRWFPPGPGESHRTYGANLDRRFVIPSAARQHVTSPYREVARAHLGLTSLSEVPVSAAPIGGDDAAAGGVVDGAKTLHDATPGLEHMQEQRTTKTSLIKIDHVQPHNDFHYSFELDPGVGADAPILGKRSMGLLAGAFLLAVLALCALSSARGAHSVGDTLAILTICLTIDAIPDEHTDRAHSVGDTVVIFTFCLLGGAISGELTRNFTVTLMGICTLLMARFATIMTFLAVYIGYPAVCAFHTL